jgi:interferon gamma-inducible protein 30
MHACALKYIKSPEAQLDFIYCSMSAKYPPESLSDCAKTVAAVDETEIRRCAEGSEGSELLAQNGQKTHALTPKLYFVPWITYDGKFDDDKLQSSQTSFKSVVCNELKDNGVSPPECEATRESWAARMA